MCLGSESERFNRQGECRTTEDVRRLFERYRVEARLFAEMSGEPDPMAQPQAQEPVEPLVTTR
jgi:hypothetical protein